MTIDLTTNYLGLTLRSPLVVSASPLSEKLDNLARMEEAGAGAIVLHSLFEEQISLESEDLDRNLFEGTDSFAEALTYFPALSSYHVGPEGYLEHIRAAKAAVGVPVIASLNGVSSGGWIAYAKKMEEAGADALELNTYFLSTDPARSSADVEAMLLDLVRDIKTSIDIPVAVKLSPYFAAMAHLGRALDGAGADGLVLFNRFYEPDLDLDQLEVAPSLELSTSSELLLRLHWAAILYGRVHADLAVTGGVHTATDALKAVMAGADVVMMTSALLRNGIGHLAKVRDDMVAWMTAKEYRSIAQMRGSMSHRSVAEPAAYERANYMKVLRGYAAGMKG